MYIRRDQANEMLQSSVSGISEQLHAHLDFVSKLLDGDDWSFVIKAQALVEASVTQAVVTRLGDKRICKMVETMPLVGNSVSKLQMAKDLGLMDSAQRRFATRLATLRNRLAHRVDCIDFNFQTYMESLNKEARREWQESIVWFCSETGPKHQWQEIALKQPRMATVMASFMLAAFLAIEDNQTELLRAIDSASAQATAELLGSLKVP